MQGHSLGSGLHPYSRVHSLSATEEENQTIEASTLSRWWHCFAEWLGRAQLYVMSLLNAVPVCWCSLENIRWKEILGWLGLLGLLSLDSSCLRPSLALNVFKDPTSCSLSMSLPPPSGESLTISPEQHLTSSSLFTSFTIRCQDVCTEASMPLFRDSI